MKSDGDEGGDGRAECGGTRLQACRGARSDAVAEFVSKRTD